MKRKGQESWQGKTAVITGASSGIGSAVAMQLAHEGLRVLLAARRLDKLSQVKAEIERLGGQAEIIQADLENEEERRNLFAKSLEFGDVDVLVNNAGFGWYGYYADMPWETTQSMIHLNVEAVAHLTSLYLGHMQERGTGHIINIGSISGSFPNQGTSAYSASKAYLNAFTTVLFRELRPTQIHASLVLPGPVATEFFDYASNSRGSRSIPAERFAVSPQRVAACVWSLLKRPRRLAYVPWWLGAAPWVELFFGWFIDLLGPLLLRRTPAQPRPAAPVAPRVDLPKDHG